MKPNFAPTMDNVVVQAIKEKKSESLIYIPETVNKEQPMVGMVIATGAGITASDGSKIPMEVKPGDKVIYNRFGGNMVNIDGQEYLILKEREILCIITDN